MCNQYSVSKSNKFTPQRIKFNNVAITIYHKGRNRFSPVTYPSFEGIKHQIEYKGYRFIFDLTGEIKYILNTNVHNWPDPLARIKRTIANEWVVYLSYGYEDIYALTGVYYIPVRERLDYVPIVFDSPFKSKWFKDSIDCFYELIGFLPNCCKDISLDISNIILKIINANKNLELKRKAHIFHHLISGTVPILPPDTVFVDYNVIPILISDGCLYNCKFCCLKTGNEWRQRTKSEITTQIKRLKEFFSEDIINYPAIFLGQNDALASSPELILETATIGFESLLKDSIFIEKSLYIFASTTSLLNAPSWLFKELNKIGYKNIYINCGIESFEQEVLNLIGKPISNKETNEAYKLALDINRDTTCIEISFNLLISKNFPLKHIKTLYEKITFPTFKLPKGAIYISPILGEQYSLRDLKDIIFKLKANSKWDINLYLMQGI